MYGYFADSEKWEAFSDTKVTLESIKMAGMKVGAISNFDERLGTIMCGCLLIVYSAEMPFLARRWHIVRIGDCKVL